MRADESIRVSRVANDTHLDGLLGHFIDGSTLSLENLRISSQ